MRTIRAAFPLRTAALTLALLGTALANAGTAAAQGMGIGQTGLINQGEQMNVPYPPGYDGNIVGGGAVGVLNQGGQESRIVHYDDNFAFAAPGIPVDTGGRSGEVVYLEPGQTSADPMMLASRDNTVTAVQ
jgi:hypothetical protein